MSVGRGAREAARPKRAGFARAVVSVMKGGVVMIGERRRGVIGFDLPYFRAYFAERVVGLL